MEATDWQSLPKKERRRLKKEQKRLKRNQAAKKSQLKKWSLLLGVVVLLAGGAFLYQYIQSKTYANAPKIQILPLKHDFGKVSLKEKKQTSFLIKNSGTSPLTLLGARTSCDCTTAQFKIGESQSPIFGMHEPPSWSVTLKVGETGELVVFYDPAVHPEVGSITRVVSIFSNDPRGKEKKVTVYAEVTP